MNTNSKSIYLSTIRQFVYLVVLTLIVVGFWKLGEIYKNAAVMENGIFENLQTITLAVTSLLFIVTAWCNKGYRPIFFLMSMLALAAVIREQDAFFDELMPSVGWAWCWIFPAAGAVAIFRSRSTILPKVDVFLTSRTFHMMLTAGVVMIPIAQCLGHRSFLVDLMNNDMYDAVLIRRILEETVELMAYIVLFLSAVESLIEFRRK